MNKQFTIFIKHRHIQFIGFLIGYALSFDALIRNMPAGVVVFTASSVGLTTILLTKE